MLKVVFKSRFKEDLKKLKSAKRNEDELIDVIEMLVKEEILAEKFRDHALIGNYVDHRECQIESDWLLVYNPDLTRVGDRSVVALFATN